MDWAKFWAIFFTNSSGHPAADQQMHSGVEKKTFRQQLKSGFGFLLKGKNFFPLSLSLSVAAFLFCFCGFTANHLVRQNPPVCTIFKSIHF
jgi:hypothetical protein